MGKSDTTNRSADIIVIDEKDRILMQLRDKEGEHRYPDCWSLPGGSIEEGESPEDGIKREFKEETGCSCSPEFLFVEKYKTEDGRVIDKYVYKYRYDGCIIESLEGQAFEFKTLDQIERMANKNPNSEVLIRRMRG